MAAERLARAGARVTLFEENEAWEKPCGGGVPYKALRRYPFLLEASDEHVCIDDVELVAANGSAVRIRLRQPLAIYSRFVLNRLLLRRAREAGAEIVQERIQGFRRTGSGWRLEIRGRRSPGEDPLRSGRSLSMPTSLPPSDFENRRSEAPHPTAYGGHPLPQGGEGCGPGCFHARATTLIHTEDYSAEYLILSAGARSQLRSLLAAPLGARDFMLTFGYYAPSVDRLLRVQFFEGFEGYAW
jgi:flavin-dependent dehydrogenase